MNCISFSSAARLDSGPFGGFGRRSFDLSRLKRSTGHNTEYESRKAVILHAGFARDRTNNRHIAIVCYAAETICQQVFGKSPDKCIAMAQNRISKTNWAVKAGSIEHVSGGVHWRGSVISAPHANSIKILQCEANWVHKLVASCTNRSFPVCLHAIPHRHQLRDVVS